MYTIRRGNIEDLEILADHNQAMAMETENLALPRVSITAGLKSMLNDSNKGFYIVAEREGIIVANLMITVEWSDWRNAPMWWFQSVFVRPEHRSKGVFKEMYHFIMNEARTAGAGELRLYVEKTNVNAQKVYEALGMQQSHYLMYEVEV